MVYRSVATAMRMTSLFIGTSRLIFLEGLDDDFGVDFVIIISVCLLGFDTLLKSAIRPAYALSLSFSFDILSTICLIPFVSNLMVLWQDYPIIEICIAGMVQLRVINLINSLQKTKLLRALSKRYIGFVTSSGYSDRENSPGSPQFRRLSSVTEIVNDDEELERRLLLEEPESFHGKISLRPERPTCNPPSQNEDSRIRRKLTYITTTRIGVLVILGSMVGRILRSNDESFDSSNYFLLRLNATRPTSSNDSDEFWGIVFQTISGLSTEVSSLASIGCEYEIPPISSHLLDTLLYDQSIDSSKESILRHGFGRFCEQVSHSSRWWLLISSTCPDMANRRPSEIQEISSKESPFVLLIDRSESIRWSAILSVIRTLLISALIFLTSLAFQYDSWRIILLPLSRIISVMNHIQSNPLSANLLIENEQRRAIEAGKAGENWSKRPFWERLLSRKPQFLKIGLLDLESDHGRLEATLLKLGSLLSVSLGGAGAESISMSLSGDRIGSFSSRPIRAVFCFIDIDHFNTLTEVLQDRTILLVNSVAEIVHGLVDEFNGFVCRNNVGTSGGFFLIWRCDAEKELEVESIQQIDRRMAELAIVCVCKIFAAVERSPLLLAYRDHPYLKQLIPNYSVRLTAGLHLGVSIEGTIGSEFKLEATYVGNDVLLAQHLAGISRTTYRTRLALSGALFNSVSSRFRMRLCRKIDTTAINGEEHSVYTIDLDLAEVGPQGRRSILQPYRKEPDNPTQALMEQFGLKQASYLRKRTVKDTDRFTPIVEFDGYELARMRKRYETKDGKLFTEIFKKGFLNFEARELDVAKKALVHSAGYWARYMSLALSRTRVISATFLDDVSHNPERDGPSDALLEKIQSLELEKLGCLITMPRKKGM